MNNKKLALAVIAVLLVAGLIGAGIMAGLPVNEPSLAIYLKPAPWSLSLHEETPAKR